MGTPVASTTTHVRHDHVAEDEVELIAPLADDGEGLQAVLGDEDRIAVTLEDTSPGAEDRRLILDEQDGLSAAGTLDRAER
jgi:hypothetical protein